MSTTTLTVKQKVALYRLHLEKNATQRKPIRVKGETGKLPGPMLKKAFANVTMTSKEKGIFHKVCSAKTVSEYLHLFKTLSARVSVGAARATKHAVKNSWFYISLMYWILLCVVVHTFDNYTGNFLTGIARQIFSGPVLKALASSLVFIGAAVAKVSATAGTLIMKMLSALGFEGIWNLIKTISVAYPLVKLLGYLWKILEWIWNIIKIIKKVFFGVGVPGAPVPIPVPTVPTAPPATTMSTVTSLMSTVAILGGLFMQGGGAEVGGIMTRSATEQILLNTGVEYAHVFLNFAGSAVGLL